MARHFAAWVLCTCWTAAAAPALADDCAAPELLNSTSLTAIPGDSRMLVPVSVNGQDKNLLLDTAGGRTTLTAAAARTLNLEAVHNLNVRLLDDSGNASHDYFNVDSIQVGNLRARKVSLMLTPDPDFGVRPPLDGVLAPDLMELYDIEVDFTTRQLNYYSQKHCDGHIAFWQGTGIGVAPISVHKRSQDRPRNAPITSNIVMFGGYTGGLRMPGGGVANSASGGGALADPGMQDAKPGLSGIDIRLHVTLDGHDFTAQIDTGRQESTLNSDAARAVFNVTAASPGSTPAARSSDGGPGNGTETVVVLGSRSFEHSFHTLSFGDISVLNPHFVVHPDFTGEKDRDNNSLIGGHISRADDGLAPDITIGMDVLRQLHLYFAFKENRLYVSAATPAASHL